MPDAETIGTSLRLVAAAVEVSGHNEESMYPTLTGAIKDLLPTGFSVIVRAHDDDAENKPDMTIVDRSGGKLAVIEVKKPSTLLDAYSVPPNKTEHQVERYRRMDVPAVILTDSVRWYDVSECDVPIDKPTINFSDGSSSADEVAETELRNLLATLCKVRSRPNLETATLAITGVVDRINLMDSGRLARGWSIVRDGLGLVLDDDSLDLGGVGEIVVFTLLGMATQLPSLNDRDFVNEARSEWVEDARRWDSEELPSLMAATLRAFRDEDSRVGILGSNGWVEIRSIARWVADDAHGHWTRLSALWDSFLHRAGRRKTLGSWQTPYGVASYQAVQTSEALKSLGYLGINDDAVTIIDPCCGTGIYLEAVVSQCQLEGGHPESFNAPRGGLPRLLGVDISSTAIAASHIRLHSTGARPALYMTDTLAASGGTSIRSIFDAVGNRGNEIVGAALDDFDNVRKWASRDPARDPVIAIIGNPPYLRYGLDPSRYEPLGLGWYNELFESWRRGSGGRGSLQDLFVGFWAWAFDLCKRGHPAIEQLAPSDLLSVGNPDFFGVVSFITNRNWLDGKTFGPMRKWVSAHATLIDITDFGPGSRGGGAASWSDQPFPIETGTAIVTLVFNPRDETRQIKLCKGRWESGKVVAEPSIEVTTRQTQSLGAMVDLSWLAVSFERDLTNGISIVSGIRTGEDKQWIRTDGDREFGTRHAYRAFDNRWSPTVPPKPARRGVTPALGEAKASAFWRQERLFDHHRQFHADGGWYAVLQSASARSGPAIHPTRSLPDYHFFKGSEGGGIVRVAPGIAVPPDYREWADGHQLDGEMFWRYMLAAAHHIDYWTAGTALADQVAQQRVEPPITDDATKIKTLLSLADALIDLWSLVDVVAPPPTGRPGEWHFDNHDEADAIVVNGRRVLHEWRKARPGDWNKDRATEYSRSVAAVLKVFSIAQEVADTLSQ